MKLRAYQEEARTAVIETLDRVRRALLVMPTGCGKTVTFAQIAAFAQSHGMRVLVLAHRRELLTQAQATFERFGLAADLEVADLQAPLVSSRHVIGSVQTLQGKRLQGWYRDSFGLVIIDEAHHATAKTYRNILAHFGEALTLGVTATPDRGDGVALRTVFDEVAYTYDIKTAIADGYLVPIRSRRIVVEGLDLKSVKLKGRGRFTDFDEKALGELLQRDESLHGMAQPIVAEAGERSTLVFCAGVEHARVMAEVINRYAGAGRALALDGSASDEERAEVIARFRGGDLQFLCNCMLFLEGFDAPRTSCVAMARPWKVRAPYVQAVGRGTRLHPESGKRDLLVLDFVGASDDHSLICPADILEGKTLEEHERRAVAKALEEDPELDVGAALSAAEAALLAAVTVDVRYKAFDSDPFVALGVTRPREDPEWAQPATPAQLSTKSIRSLGKAAEGLSRREASELISSLCDRAADGLATYRQLRTIARFGFDPAGISYTEAGRLIAAIAANGWRRPDDLVAERVPATEPTAPEEPASGQRRTHGR